MKQTELVVPEHRNINPRHRLDYLFQLLSDISFRIAASTPVELALLQYISQEILDVVKATVSDSFQLNKRLLNFKERSLVREDELLAWLTLPSPHDSSSTIFTYAIRIVSAAIAENSKESQRLA